MWTDQTVFRSAALSTAIEMGFQAMVDADMLDPLQENVVKQLVEILGQEWIRRMASTANIGLKGGSRTGVMPVVSNAFNLFRR